MKLKLKDDCSPVATQSLLDDPPDASALLALNGWIQLRLLGSGMSGRVFACCSRTNQSNEVAVKMVLKSLAEGHENRQSRETVNPLNELTILRSLGRLALHDNVVRFYHDFQNTHYLCIIMELCAGGDLDSYLRARINHSVSEREALEILHQINSGLEFLHQNEIIHRDIKCANVLLKHGASHDAPVLFKVGDFGFAKRLAPGERATTILGTPLFMAPEVLMKNAYSFSADYWSLGCIFYSCLYGKRPFHGSNPKDLLKSILSKRGPSPLMNVPSLPPISPATHRVLSSLLSVRPEGRLMMRPSQHHQGNHSAPGLPPSPCTSSYVGRIWDFAAGYIPNRSTARKRAFSDDYVVVESALASIPEANEIASTSTTKAKVKERVGPPYPLVRRPRKAQWRDRLRTALVLVPIGDFVVGVAIVEKSSRRRAHLLSRAGALYIYCLDELQPILSPDQSAVRNALYTVAFTLFEQVLERILQCAAEVTLCCPMEGMRRLICRILSLADAEICEGASEGQASSLMK